MTRACVQSARVLIGTGHDGPIKPSRHAMHQSIMMFALLRVLMPPARLELATYGLADRRSVPLSYGGIKTGSGANHSRLDRYRFFLIRMRSGKAPPSARRTILPVFQWRNDLTNMVIYSPSLSGRLLMFLLSFLRGRRGGRDVVRAMSLPIGRLTLVSQKWSKMGCFMLAVGLESCHNTREPSHQPMLNALAFWFSEREVAATTPAQLLSGYFT